MAEAPLPNPPMEFFNSMGGFAKDGREYLTVLDGNQRTPAPWINVVANPSFGFITSTDGGGFSWSINAQQNAITPWSNDAVGDPPGEILYVRDEETGELWGPTSLPIRERNAPYTAAHGQGYSRFEHTSHGIALELTQFVPKDDPVKISRLKISNRSGRARRLSVAAYVEWVLGANRSATQSYVVTEIDTQTGAILASNPWHEQFGERVAFCDLGGKQTAWTCDRTEFLGRDGALDYPRGLAPGAILSNKAGAGMDPVRRVANAGALEPRRARTEIVFVIGQAGSSTDARALIAKYRAADLDAVFADVTGHVGRHAEHGTGEDAGSRAGYPAQPLDSVSDPGLPRLGAHGLLSGERRLRLPRPVAGRDGALHIAARDRARAYTARRRTTVRGRRCAALVVAGIGTRHSHAHFRRSRRAGLCHRALRQHDRRYRDPQRDGAVPRGARAARRRA